MNKTLTVHNAEISTATVSIHTLTISGKQVTLATFRQLYDEPLIDEAGNFQGLPWGRVHYHPDKSCNGGEHEHVVWQTGDELRRASVNKPDWEHTPFWAPTSDLYVLVRGLLPGPPSPGYGKDRYYDWKPPEWFARVHGLYGNVVPVGRWIASGVQCEARFPSETSQYRDSAMILAKKVEALPQEQIVADFRTEVTIEAARRAAINQRWAEVMALPQLFIAT